MNKCLRENGLVEIICEHGIGHPSLLLTPSKFYYGTHGCDGCCSSEVWKDKEVELVNKSGRKAT